MSIIKHHPADLRVSVTSDLNNSDLESLLKETIVNFSHILIGNISSNLIENKQFGIIENMQYIDDIQFVIRKHLNKEQVQNVCNQIQVITSHFSVLGDGKDTQKNIEHAMKIQKLIETLREYCQKSNIVCDEDISKTVNNLTKEEIDQLPELLAKAFPESRSDD